MPRKKDPRPKDSKPAVIDGNMMTEADVAEIIASAPLQIGPPELPADLLERAVAAGRRLAPAVPELRHVGNRADKGSVFELDQTWTERLERLAQSAGGSPSSYLLMLLRRAWASMPRAARPR